MWVPLYLTRGSAPTLPDTWVPHPILTRHTPPDAWDPPHSRLTCGTRHTLPDARDPPAELTRGTRPTQPDMWEPHNLPDAWDPPAELTKGANARNKRNMSLGSFEPETSSRYRAPLTIGPTSTWCLHVSLNGLCTYYIFLKQSPLHWASSVALLGWADIT